MRRGGGGGRDNTHQKKPTPKHLEPNVRESQAQATSLLQDVVSPRPSACATTTTTTAAHTTTRPPVRPPLSASVRSGGVRRVRRGCPGVELTADATRVDYCAVSECVCVRARVVFIVCVRVRVRLGPFCSRTCARVV